MLGSPLLGGVGSGQEHLRIAAGGADLPAPDPTRLKLLEYILAGERTSADCVAHAGISQPRVSVHLSCLADCGYIVARRDGKKLRYTVGDPRVAELVLLARLLAADNAAALTCCTRIDQVPDGDRT